MHSPRRFLTAILVAVASVSAIQYRLIAHNNSVSAAQWEVVELDISLPPSSDNPFDRLPLAHCEGPNRAIFSVPGYYIGGSAYRFRISFPEKGDWSVTSMETNDTWKISVSPADPETLGPVVINEETPQHFHYATGEPCFVLAFEADWLFAIDLEVNGIKRAETLLRDIKSNGFNQVVMNVYAHDVNWDKDPKLPAKYNFSAPKQWPYGGDNDNPDYSRLNLDFFNHFDQIIALMNELDITAHIMIYVWNKNVNWPEVDSPDDNRYFDYVVARYQAYPNIIWDISKEATGYGHNDMEYIVRRIDRLRNLDGHDRLVTVHSFSYCAEYPETVDFISYQNWSASLFSVMKDTYERFTNKPIFNIEHGGYEGGPFHVFDGDYEDSVACLDRNYQCVFAGTYSTHYWQDTSWNVVIWDREDLPESQRPQYELYGHMAKLFQDIDYSKLSPPETRLSSSGFALASEDHTYLFYLPAANKRINTRIEPFYGKKMRAKWFNPITGEYSKESNTVMEKWLRFNPPWENQPTILILQP